MKYFKVILSFSFLFFLASCSPKYFTKVDPQTKTKFGMTVSAPSIAIFFVENENSSKGAEQVDQHKKIADKLYNKYGPARDGFLIARTNARDFKFNLNNSTYYIDIQDVPQRTAMLVFDGKHKPTVYFDINKYEEIVDHIVNSKE